MRQSLAGCAVAVAVSSAELGAKSLLAIGQPDITAKVASTYNYLIYNNLFSNSL
jgi:hypothetical protein